MENNSLNATQTHLLKMFSFIKSEEGLTKLQSVLFDYYRKELKELTNEFWVSNKLDNEKMEEIMYGHSRISIK